MWNILFNLGFMYTAIKNTIFFFYVDTSVANTNNWTNLGSNVGEFLMRFIYSRFIEKTYYKL